MCLFGYLHSVRFDTFCNAQCFGHGEYGALGSGSTANIGSGKTGDNLPTVVFGVDFNVTALATGEGYVFHHCALSVTSAMRCWGYNDRGRLGMGDTKNRLSPVTPLIQFAITAFPTNIVRRMAVLKSISATMTEWKQSPAQTDICD